MNKVQAKVICHRVECRRTNEIEKGPVATLVYAPEWHRFRCVCVSLRSLVAEKYFSA